jgi:hypothetical protein
MSEALRKPDIEKIVLPMPAAVNFQVDSRGKYIYS